MEANRIRFGAVLEWLIAAACIVAALGLGSIAVRELETLRAMPPVSAEARPPVEAPASVPSGAVSVPMLVLSNQTRLHVGEPVRGLDAKVPRRWQVGEEAVERGPRGNRITRSYDDGATRFLVVVEPFEEGGAPQISAIYVR